MCSRERERVERKSRVLVSACLLGVQCRYDGGSALVDTLLEIERERDYVPVCPEQLGGLPTPREKAHVQGGDGFDVLDGKATVMTERGQDVTAQFVRGAEEVLNMARALGVRKALLKEKSPSCGMTFVHRETGLAQGVGVTAALLMRHGIEVAGI